MPPHDIRIISVIRNIGRRRRGGGTDGPNRSTGKVIGPVVVSAAARPALPGLIGLRLVVSICRFVSFVVAHAQAMYDEAQAMTEWLSRITVNPGQCGGRPCIRGMRIRVTDVLDLLAAGLTREQVLSELPDLEPEDITAALHFASRKLDHPVLVG
jgi:uncharacterized protein (DUF433 family)